MEDNISNSDEVFEYMKSKLISHLKKHNPDFLCETDFIAIKADNATIIYNRLIKSGVNKENALQQALHILFSKI